jgi:WD40 domain-containing protein
MPKRNEKGFEQERDAFEQDMDAARAAIEAGNLDRAADLAVSPAHLYWYAKEPKRFELLRDLHSLIPNPIDEAIYRKTRWQQKLLTELYKLWPKTSLDAAILRHDFLELDVTAREKLLGTLEIDGETFTAVRRQIHESKISGTESIQFAKYYTGLISKAWGALSRGRHWLKFWDLETGEIIRAEERSLPLLASSISRDGSHVLFSQSWIEPATEELHWSTGRIETFRKIRLSRAGTFRKSEYRNVNYYKLAGKVVSYEREETLEIDRKEFEANPIRGEILEPRDFWRHHSPRYQEWIREVYSPEEAEHIFQENALEEEREKRIVRIRKYQTLTIEHDEIEGYLPAGTTTFVAVDGLGDPLKASDALWAEGRISATLAVEDDESWLEEIVMAGRGLRSMNNIFSTPITDVHITADGSLGLANGNGNSFGIWNLWTATRLREFHGHTDRVTCLCPSIDVSLVASGSEDKTVRIWTPINAQCVRVLEGHDDSISKVYISLDATRVLSADRSGILKLWDIDGGACLRTIQAHAANISALYFLFDGKFAVSGSWDKTVKLWNLTDGSCMKTLEFDDWVTSVDMTPDGRYLAASSYEGTKVWELIWRLKPHDAVEWDERARPYLEILMNANAAWEGKLGLMSIDMTDEEIKNSLRKQSPSWTAWHSPSDKNDWGRVWHLDWNVEETIGYAGYGWLSEVGEEGNKIMDDWRSQNRPQES